MKLRCLDFSFYCSVRIHIFLSFQTTIFILLMNLTHIQSESYSIQNMTHIQSVKVLALNKEVVNISAFLELPAILYQIKDSSITALQGNSKDSKVSQASVPSPYYSFCACYLLRSAVSLLAKASFIPLSPRLKTPGFSL